MGFVLFTRLPQAIAAYQRHAKATGLEPAEIDQGRSTRSKGGTWNLSDGYSTVARVTSEGTVTVTQRQG